MIPLHEDPCFTFRFADDRIIPRFHLEGIEAGRRVEVFKIDPGSGERLGLLATATVGEGGWVDLRESFIVRAGEAFVAVTDPEEGAMAFAKWVYLLAGITGVLMVIPPYFLEEQFGRDNPPPINHPELYYGFFGVTLSWQFMFLVIGSDPVRFRRAMLPAMLEKASFAVAILILYALGRVALTWVGFASMDATWLVLFLIAYLRTPKGGVT